ncbi:hypothetical protein F5Y17DRAFT_453560 [Xylariaceae sp. FL0594]|nr:hypothetical protein F5Y17DRAFT_453560 [Xylariaceae sp. FL0594]
MPITEIACVLCGGAVIEQGQAPSWMSQFCAIYALGDTSTSAYWSAHGKRERFLDAISATSEDGQESDVEIWLGRTCFQELGPTSFPPTNPPAWGFAFHCSCWELLKASSPTKDIRLQSLFDLCRSFPKSLCALDFGHDYGGLYQREPQLDVTFPLCAGEESWLSEIEDDSDSKVVQSHKSDPLDISFLVGMAEDDEASGKLGLPPKSFWKTVTTYDPFGRLPPEILTSLFPYLSSADILHLKLSSRVVADTPLPDAFWHSRFCDGREFHYVFEFAERFKHRGKWRSIYLLVRHLRHHPSLVNRRRIWDLAAGLHNLISLTGTCHGNALRSHLEPDAPSDSRSWITASSKLWPYSDTFPDGSRSLHDRFLALPDRLSSISVSVTDLCTGRYVSGFQFQDMDGNRWNLGYFQAHSSVTVATADILGFLVARDPRGIRGVRVLNGSGSAAAASPWIGEHQDIPKRRLVLPRPIGGHNSPVNYIKGGFDACKVVSLAISGDTDPAGSSDQLGPSLCLQDAATWYPDIPPSAFSFLGVSGNIGFRPLEAAIFSDSAGVSLRNVIGIRARTIWFSNDEYYSLLSLQVDLDEPLNGQTRVEIGLPEGTLEAISRDQDEEVEEHNFLIDSAAGERIIGVDVNSIADEDFLGLEVHTSFNRSAQFPQDHTLNLRRQKDLKTVRLWPETGHILGFYGTVMRTMGVVRIGIVCGGPTTLRQFPSEAPDSPAA